MAETPIPRQRETWFVTNVTNNNIKLTDIPSVPIIKPGQKIDLLIYARFSIVQSSTTVSGYLANGNLTSEEYLHTHNDKAEVIHYHDADEVPNHNNLEGLNVEDYIHLTAAEKINFDKNTIDRHDEIHTIISHTDTSATGTELNILTDGSNADALHIHTIISHPDHNSLSNLQGGTTDEYYHLTEDENNLVSRLGEDSAGLTFDDISLLDTLWSRSGTTLSPLNSGDNVNISGDLKISSNIGFYGESPVTQNQLQIGSTTDDVITELQRLGLVREAV